MKPEERLKVLGEKWANLPNNSKEAADIADEICELVPELLSKAEELEKVCAFYRDALKCIRDFDDDSPWDDPGACALDALKRCDCGSEYIHRDLLEKAYRAACHFMVCRECAESEPCCRGEEFRDWLATECEQALAHAENPLKGETK